MTNHPNDPHTDVEMAERFERLWLILGMAMIVVFILGIAYTVANYGGAIPLSAESVDSTKVRTEGKFANPAIEEVGNEYVIYMQAFAFGYLPNEIKVKKGRKVTFMITSPDTIHGFNIQYTNINVEVLPGEVAKVSHTFKKAGEYRIICNQYCGLGHANMLSKVVVED